MGTERGKYEKKKRIAFWKGKKESQCPYCKRSGGLDIGVRDCTCDSICICVLYWAAHKRFRPVYGPHLGKQAGNYDKPVYLLSDPKPGDIVVFLPNGNEKSHYYVKRVIGIPGDTVQIKEGEVYVNGELFEDEDEFAPILDAELAAEPVKLEEDEYFVLGDNRNNSEDSRYANIGNVKKEYIIGKAWFIISPYDSMGFIK